MVKVGLLATTMLLMVGCAGNGDTQTSDSGSHQYQYSCDEGMQFAATYLIAEQGAQIRVEEVDYSLVQAPAGSGTRYVLPESATSEIFPVTLYTKGPYARLELGRNVYKNCETNE
ncbi:MliC family protein [Vibrio renipiscarius]|uniref:MliC family protein n=1 Tax=Vibrio renipiscarius TaxID=1461322 RepID=UPI0035538BE2